MFRWRWWFKQELALDQQMFQVIPDQFTNPMFASFVRHVMELLLLLNGRRADQGQCP